LIEVAEVLEAFEVDLEYSESILFIDLIDRIASLQVIFELSILKESARVRYQD
jgi:hypothetical protein